MIPGVSTQEDVIQEIRDEVKRSTIKENQNEDDYDELIETQV
jgi:hypothetical protein